MLADPDEPGKATVSVRERVRAEVDLMVGRATFLVRATSLRYPANGPGHQANSRATGRRPAGATAWADATPSQPKARRTGEPHIAFTKKSEREQDRASRTQRHADDSYLSRRPGRRPSGLRGYSCFSAGRTRRRGRPV